MFEDGLKVIKTMHNQTNASDAKSRAADLQRYE